MKRGIIVLVLVILSGQLFADHYQQKGNIDKETSLFTIKETKPSIQNGKTSNTSSITLAGQAIKEYFETNSINDYLGASGRTHKISDLFSTYQRRALSMGENSHSFVSDHDTDVMVVFTKKGKDYTVDIYTGEDALKQKAELNKK